MSGRTSWMIRTPADGEVAEEHNTGRSETIRARTTAIQILIYRTLSRATLLMSCLSAGEKLTQAGTLFPTPSLEDGGCQERLWPRAATHSRLSTPRTRTRPLPAAALTSAAQQREAMSTTAATGFRT